MPERIFGSVQRPQLLNALQVKPTRATDYTLFGDHPAALIDAAGEYAAFEVHLPKTFTQNVEMAYIVVSCPAAGPTNNMKMDINWEWGGNGESTSLVNNNSPMNLVGPLLQNRFYVHSLIGYFDWNTLAPYDNLGLRFVHSAVATATNLYVYSFNMRWY